jgi:hypothetical protein
MKGYKNYSEINFQKIFEEYQKNNLTQTEISKKYNIPYSTFNSRYVKWKMRYMNGGNNVSGNPLNYYEKNNDTKNSEEINVFNKKSNSELSQKGGYQTFTDTLINKREIKPQQLKTTNKKSESKSESSLNMQTSHSDKKKKVNDVSMLGFDDLIKENDNDIKKHREALKEKYGN